jgi:hypothetical protein
MFEDLDKVLAEDGRQLRRLCAFSRWAEGLSENDRTKAHELVANKKKYNCRQLARYFITKGATLNDQVLSRHRNRQCCGQPALDA